MRDSPLIPGFMDLLGALCTPERRWEKATELARLLGGEELLLFAPDPELGVPLPAPGLPQVLRGAVQWRQFLDQCARAGEHSGVLPRSDGQPAPARGRALPDGTAAVLLGPRTEAADPAPLLPLLPLLGALFRAERQVGMGVARERAAADAAERANVLTRALQEMRERLSDALVAADHARDEARQRAEHAERLAAELQAQADQLQDQAMELEILNDELAARTEEAERARASADEANRAKSQFLANMSHELRTPINAVMGYTDLLDLGITGPVTPGQQAQLQRIRASSAHLLSLIDDVLDLAKVEAGHIAVQQERERLIEVVAEATDLVSVQASSRGIVLKNACPDPATEYVGDRNRVRQILVNLLSNAIKFTPPGGKVTVRCGTEGRPPEPSELSGEGPWTYVQVEDTGIGISDSDLSRIFRPFVQADSGHTRSHGGTGLGLTISRQLARLMGGDLTAQSTPGEGSRFVLWLPTTAAETGALDAAICIGVSPTATEAPAGLSEVGVILQASIPAIVASFALRARSELDADALEGLEDGDLVSRPSVLLAEIASRLAGIAEGDPSHLRDGSAVLRLVADEHGAARGRRGWTARTARREFQILQEEVFEVVRRAAADVPNLDLNGVVAVLARLMDVARRTTLRSLAATTAVSVSNRHPSRP